MLIEPCSNCGSHNITQERSDWFVWHMICNNCYDYCTELGVTGYPASLSWPETCKRDSTLKLINEWNELQNENKDWHTKEDIGG